MKVFYCCKIAANRVFALPRQKETTLRAIFEWILVIVTNFHTVELA